MSVELTASIGVLGLSHDVSQLLLCSCLYWLLFCVLTIFICTVLFILQAYSRCASFTIFIIIIIVIIAIIVLYRLCGSD